MFQTPTSFHLNCLGRGGGHNSSSLISPHQVKSSATEKHCALSHCTDTVPLAALLFQQHFSSIFPCKIMTVKIFIAPASDDVADVASITWPLPTYSATNSEIIN